MTWVEPRFRMSRWGGYDVLEVDELIDRLEATRDGTSPHTVTADQVRSAQFKVSRRAGYLEADVDAWLEQVAQDLQTGAPVGVDPAPLSTPRTASAPGATAPPHAAPVTPVVLRGASVTPGVGAGINGSGPVAGSGLPRWLVLTAIALLLVGIVLAVYALL